MTIFNLFQVINRKSSILCKPKAVNKSNNCSMATKIAKVIKYLNEVSTITVIIVP